MPWAILDTSIYIGHWERGLYEEALAGVRRAFVVRHSSVVLSELRRGARTRQARRLVDSLHRLAHVQWAPTTADWWEAGRLIRDIGDDQGWDLSKRRNFQNDALIGLTAYHYGATVVTANHWDFELLARTLRFPVLLV
jgi:predicted nucleic acid-binding protein